MSIKNVGDKSISTLRFFHNDILKKYVTNLKGVNTILDAGGSQDQEDDQGTLYCNYFPSVKYYTLDKNRGISKDNHFNMDLHDLSLLDKKFNLVLCTSVLEHVKNPFKVSQQLESISNKYIFIVVPFIFPYHPKADNSVKDYWRFTDSGLRELFCNSEEIWIKKCDSVIVKVKDKKRRKNRKKKGWNVANSATGYAALFKVK